MRAEYVVLLVLFIMTMFLWLLSMIPSSPLVIGSSWLAFFACLFLGIAVFLGMRRGGQ